MARGSSVACTSTRISAPAVGSTSAFAPEKKRFSKRALIACPLTGVHTSRAH